MNFTKHINTGISIKCYECGHYISDGDECYEDAIGGLYCINCRDEMK
jgi:hypothetical protein